MGVEQALYTFVESDNDIGGRGAVGQHWIPGNRLRDLRSRSARVRHRRLRPTSERRKALLKAAAFETPKRSSIVGPPEVFDKRLLCWEYGR